MKFFFSFLSVGFLGLTISGLFGRRLPQDDTALEDRRASWVPRCECGCGGADEECEFFDSDIL